MISSTPAAQREANLPLPGMSRYENAWRNTLLTRSGNGVSCQAVECFQNGMFGNEDRTWRTARKLPAGRSPQLAEVILSQGTAYALGEYRPLAPRKLSFNVAYWGTSGR